AGLGLIVYTAREFPGVTLALNVASVIMFAASFWAAQRLLGRGLAGLFAAMALCLGWFAEQMGSSRGWFFGRYTYTDVLGLQLGNVPLVIPMMWFALCFTGYVMASFLLWRQPVPPRLGLGGALLVAWLAAMIVTAFDLGADPYFVFVLKAWIMKKTDGGWFGETLQGFAGWMLIGGLIVIAFQLVAASRLPSTTQDSQSWLATLVPLCIYASALIFQLAFGHPIEIRAIAFFAMGIPLLVTTVSWWQWKHRAQRG
ncbi:MAG TPA: carotenoid biosynthesis protein, partial [Hydrogenophaga sp.]